MSDVFAVRLLADRPTGGDMDLFGQFVGSWDIDVRWHEHERVTRREHGEWHFSWVLAGRAIQDVWIVPTLDEQARGAPVYEYGSSLRTPDLGGEFWHSTWHGPVRGLVKTFTACRQGADIVLTDSQATGSPLRWVFPEITPHRFRWRNEQADGAGAYSCVQDFIATRRN